MSDKLTPDEVLAAWDKPDRFMAHVNITSLIIDALREAIRQRDEAQAEQIKTQLSWEVGHTLLATANRQRDEAWEALRSWLAAYDSCGPDNGPSLTEHDCAECARALLNKSEGWDE